VVAVPVQDVVLDVQVVTRHVPCMHAAHADLYV
jgi:hypothetical protein